MTPKEIAASNFKTIRQASKNHDLGLAASSIVATGEPVAILIATYMEGDEHIIVPLAVLRMTNPLDEQGRIKPETKEKFEELNSILRNTKYCPFFFTDDDDRVIVAMATKGTTAQECDALLTMPWDNPYELFRDPAAYMRMH
jgi:hypothetical protein